jgi:hypothetical protein
MLLSPYITGLVEMRDLPAGDRDLDAAVLGHAAFSDIQLGENLDAGRHPCLHLGRQAIHLGHDPSMR